MAKDDIRQRLTELQGQVAKSATVTVESILAELDQAIEMAKLNKQSQPVVSAITLKAKLSGLMVERVELGRPGEFEGLESKAQIVDRFFEKLIERFLPIDDNDKRAFVALIDRQLQEQAEFMAAIEARPILAERVDIRNLSKPWNEHQPYSARSPARIGYRNGSKQA
jgi:hypothetical protein